MVHLLVESDISVVHMRRYVVSYNIVCLWFSGQGSLGGYGSIRRSILAEGN